MRLGPCTCAKRDGAHLGGVLSDVAVAWVFVSIAAGVVRVTGRRR